MPPSAELDMVCEAVQFATEKEFRLPPSGALLGSQYLETKWLRLNTDQKKKKALPPPLSGLKYVPGGWAEKAIRNS